MAPNVLATGCGGLNIDGTRIDGDARPVMVRTATVVGANAMAGASTGATSSGEVTTLGRWPANVVLDEEAAALLDEQSGERPAGSFPKTTSTSMFGIGGYSDPKGARGMGDSGGASRFFYTAKTSAKEREAGLDHLPKHGAGELTDREDGSDGLNSPRAGAGRTAKGRANIHPTVKPIALMRWLVRLVTPPGGLVLDPFTGSGSTGCATVLEGMHFLGCELTAEYCTDRGSEILHWSKAS